MKKYQIVFFTLLVAGVINAAEQVFRLTPTDDVYTYKNGDIRGMEDLLKTYHSTAGSQYRRITYLKFDISQVPTEVDSVKLRLYTNGWGEDGTNIHQFDLYPVALNTWAEDDVTFLNCKEKVGEDMTNLLASAAFVQDEAHAQGWIEWSSNELATYVQDSAAAAKNLLSFRLREKKVVKDANGEAVVVEFHSKEHNSGFAPELIVYSPEGAKPAERETTETVHDSAEARLSMIYMDGEKLEFFHKDSLAYTVLLPYTATANPMLTAIPLDTIATWKTEGTAITCTSADGKHTTTYHLTFEVLPELDIILAIGQSNMAGRAPYADATEPMEDVYLLTPAGYMEVSSNPMNKYSNIRKDLSVQGMGPHYTCALALRDSLQKPFGFVVNAQGGSSIKLWYEQGKSNYDATVKRARLAQRYGTIRAIIWHQGSADNSAGLKDDFADYKSKLTAMVNNLRSDLELGDTWFILGELSERSDFDRFNEEVVQKVSSYITHADYIGTEGTSLMGDNIHFDAPSVRLLGKRFADKIIEHVYADFPNANPFVTGNGNDGRIYNLLGMYVGNDVHALASGCYIVNHKQIIK